ncbi:MAG: tetratricopeptide repeat-containing sulfotransferase family protein, partial [Steroidobacteraceae bacterium]
MQPTSSTSLSGTLDSTISTAYQLLKAGRVGDADVLCQGLLALTPNVKTAVLASTIAAEQNDLPRALQIVEAAIEHHGVSAELLLRQAQVLMRLRRRTEGVTAARRAEEICQADARLLQALAKFHTERDEPAEARKLLARARELLPLDPAILYDSAVCHFHLNEQDAAATLLERVLMLAPGNGFALLVRSQLGTQTATSNHVGQLRNTLLQPIRRQDAIPAYFALAKELEDLGEYDESFAALSEGNRIKRSTLDYDVRSDVAAMQNVRAHYTREALAQATAGDRSTGPIFVVGMPCTGTTLVEGILGGHADVAALGEIVDFPAEMTALARESHARAGATDPDLLRASLQMDFARLGRNYLAAVGPLTGGRAHFVDKLPFNFRYCGLIHQALPNAKIVHVTRDPLDTCYTVFKTPFMNAYHYSYQLDEVAQFYIEYRRTMDHWRTLLPGVICDVSYEELVSDPQATSRRLLEHCGLPWQDEVLEYFDAKSPSTTASTARVR